MRRILKHISTTVGTLTAHPTFSAWFADQGAHAGDRVLVNNSFLFRQGVKTNKSELYPVLEVQSEGKLPPLPTIVTGLTLNSDFRLISKRAGNLPLEVAAPDAVEQQLGGLGRLLFILIGRVEDDVVIREPLNHQSLDEVELHPQLHDRVRITGRKILVRDTFDEESLWAEFKSLPGTPAGEELASLRIALGQALDALDARTYARLIIPEASGDRSESAISSVAGVLEEERSSYHHAIRTCKGDPAVDSASYNELLRIAYNFASDALGLIRLLISISDVKPVVFWGTAGEQFRLTEAFRHLPWLRANNKPSLSAYVDAIGDARNRAFHHLFPFRKTLEVPLGETDLKSLSLRLFSEFNRRKENQLSYRDKELVDVLTEFTRARERRVPPHFWRQNIEVMDATIDLFRQTERVLTALHAESSHTTPTP